MNTDNTDWAIEATGVHRSFGKTHALQDFTLKIPRGGIYGLLGRNGAGKTTIIKALAGLIKPDQGTIQVLGHDPFTMTPQNRQAVGYLSERQVLPAHFKVSSLIDFCAPFYWRWDPMLVERLLTQFRIDPAKKISALSQGNQRAVGFILALAQRPELLILDEPAANLDVVARREFLDEILDLVRQDGPTVLLSSHILTDIERVADHIGIIADGRLLVSEPLDELKETVKQIRFHSFQRVPETFSLPGSFRTIRSGNEFLVTARVRDMAEIAAAATAHGAQYEVQDLGLEDIFIELSRH